MRAWIVDIDLAGVLVPKGLACRDIAGRASVDRVSVSSALTELLLFSS
jgi:hypothetical protein